MTNPSGGREEGLGGQVLNLLEVELAAAEEGELLHPETLFGSGDEEIRKTPPRE